MLLKTTLGRSVLMVSQTNLLLRGGEGITIIKKISFVDFEQISSFDGLFYTEPIYCFLQHVNLTIIFNYTNCTAMKLFGVYLTFNYFSLCIRVCLLAEINS